MRHKDRSPQESLQHVEILLHRHRLVENLVHQQAGGGLQATVRQDLVASLVHRQHMVELERLLNQMHPADIAFVLESLPLEDRLLVWELVRPERDGDILLEVSDEVRETLIADMDRHELLAAAESLDTDEIADLAPYLPPPVLDEVIDSLDAQNRARLQSAMSYEEGTVGALMDFDFVTVREDVTLEVVLRYVRRLGTLPDHTDKLFVVDRDNVLRGVLPLARLLVHDPEVHVASVQCDDVVSFRPLESADEAAQAFERYNLVTAPVVTDDLVLVGRLTVEMVVDFIREESEYEILSRAGLREEEDLFASVWRSARNRWTWLGVNLLTAFAASRVIGLFEGTIEKLVALATLMPIVAAISGNSGYQTTTLLIRALALGQVTRENVRQLMFKELGVGVLNGLVWGSVIGVAAWLLYDNPALGLVMATAMLFSLTVAAAAGLGYPLLMHRLGRDPALGSGVLLTATTDAMGFFIFLGLATLVLL